MLNPWALLGALLFFLFSMFGAFHFGTSYEKGQQAKVEQALRVEIQQQQADEDKKLQDTKSYYDQKQSDLEQEMLKVHTTVQTVVHTIRKEVPVYVTKEADASCTVPVGFVRVWNDSTRDPAAGDQHPAAPADPSVVLDAPSGVALSTVADTAVTNNGVYWEVVAEVKARDKFIALLYAYINQIRKVVHQ